MKRVTATIIILFFVAPSFVHAKTDKFGTWIEVAITKKILKDFEFSFVPELRLQDDFTVDEYIFEGKLSYSPLKFLDLAAAYRYSTNVKKNQDISSSSVVFDITGKTEVKRFGSSLRARFTNDTDAGDIPWSTYYFRPRAKLAYNIKGVKIEPYISYEAYFNFKENEFYKGKFDVGFNRKINKKHEIGLYYRLNDYYSTRNSINILGINYGFKF